MDSHGPLLFLFFPSPPPLPPPPLPPFPSPLALSISHILRYVKIDGASRHLRSLICIFCISQSWSAPFFLNIFPFSMTWHLFAVFSFLALWCHHLPGNPTCGSAFQALVFPGCGWAITADFRATLASLELPLLSWLPILHVDSASFTSFWGSGENNPIQNQFVSCIDSQSWDLSCHQVNSQLHEEKLSPTLQSPKKIKPAS